MNINVNDTIVVKKNHPCGSNMFRVTRIGADFKIVCLGCGREIMIPRSRIEKNIKKVIPGAENGDE